MDPGMDTELKALRKKIYTYHNKLLEIERQSRRSREEYEVRFSNKRRRVENVANNNDIIAFDASNIPLQNEYILEMMVSYLPSQDLRNCRLVCRVWNKEMSRALSSRRTLIITESDCPEANSILQSAKKTSVVALGNICFFDIANCCPLFKKLMSTFGWTLSGLKLEECRTSAQDLANILTKQAPHLESFSYKDRALPESQRVSTFIRIKAYVDNPTLSLVQLKRLHWDEEFGRVELEEIISMCPNLIELVYKNTAVPSPFNYKNLRWDTLRTLKLSPRDELRDEHVLSLTSLKLKLKRLTVFGVVPCSEKGTMQNLNKFLKSISQTLEELELFQHYTIEYRYNRKYESPCFVGLPHLRRLNIDFCILKSVEALSYFPRLKSLECKARNFTDWDAVGKKGFPEENPNLTNLNLGSIDKKHLLIFTNSFKMCLNLELDPDHLDDLAMRVIIEGCPHLQQLKIAKLGSSSRLPLTDSGLSGLKLSTCKKMSKTSVSQSIMTMSQDDLSKDMKFPAIHHLKDLIRLEIHADESFLTDISVVYGIALCKKLAILGLPKSDISDISLKAIQENLKLTLLDLPQCSKFSESAINDLRNGHKEMILQSGILGFPSRN